MCFGSSRKGSIDLKLSRSKLSLPTRCPSKPLRCIGLSCRDLAILARIPPRQSSEDYRRGGNGLRQRSAEERVDARRLSFSTARCPSCPQVLPMPRFHHARNVSVCSPSAIQLATLLASSVSRATDAAIRPGHVRREPLPDSRLLRPPAPSSGLTLAAGGRARHFGSSAT